MTYLELLELLQQLVDRHGFLKSFSYGTIADINIEQGNNEVFPKLHAILQNVNTDGDMNFSYNVRFLAFDLDKMDDSITERNISSAIINMQDIIKELKENYDDITIVNNIQMIPFQQEFTEYCSGVYADLILNVDAPNNPCDFPE